MSRSMYEGKNNLVSRKRSRQFTHLKVYKPYNWWGVVWVKFSMSVTLALMMDHHGIPVNEHGYVNTLLSSCTALISNVYNTESAVVVYPHRTGDRHCSRLVCWVLADVHNVHSAHSTSLSNIRNVSTAMLCVVNAHMCSFSFLFVFRYTWIASTKIIKLIYEEHRTQQTTEQLWINTSHSRHSVGPKTVEFHPVYSDQETWPFQWNAHASNPRINKSDSPAKKNASYWLPLINKNVLSLPNMNFKLTSCRRESVGRTLNPLL